MDVLVTGGAGYIGSTICSALKDNGHTPIILDSLITGRVEFTREHIFYQGDIADRGLLERIFSEHPAIIATIHCAALIVVPDSVARPYEYYRENVAKSLELFHTLGELGHGNVVFSSSAAIYDMVPEYMVTESSPLRPSSPYARTKYMMEMILKDFCVAYPAMHGVALRYFNPIGADPLMRTGIHIKNPSHVLGKLVDVAQGKLPHFEITGVDWPTRDGTGIRDYIHVWDLAMAHVQAVEKFAQIFERSENPESHYVVINLGTGHGVTVRELVTAFENVIGHPINQKEMPARPGDVAGAFANADTALRLIGWEAQYSVEKGIADALRWGEVRESIIKYEGL